MFMGDVFSGSAKRKAEDAERETNRQREQQEREAIRMAEANIMDSRSADKAVTRIVNRDEANLDGESEATPVKKKPKNKNSTALGFR